MPENLFARHERMLEQAVEAIQKRGYWSPFAEMPSPKAYGESANEDGKSAFEARLHKPFALEQPATSGQVGKEKSPFGIELGVTYPKADLDALFPASSRKLPQAGARLGRRRGWAWRSKRWCG